MNQPIYQDKAMLPSDMERGKIFYWLKKLSSLAAWKRILNFYRAWAETAATSLRIAEERGWGNQTSLDSSEYLLILKHLAHCEEGVRRLSKGDKRVFKFDANGKFVMADRILSHWSEMLMRIDLGENSIKEKYTPHWEQFQTTLTHACQAWGECASEILEPRYVGEPGLTMYGRWIKKEFLTMPFPDHLPAVPDPFDNVFIRTNDWTPCSGIWEPIDAPKGSEATLRSLFSRTPKPQPPYKIVGTMNYLHGGSQAPQMTIETEKDTYDLYTTWRLLWRDDRYLDNTIPDEEANYKFTTPKEIPPHSRFATQETVRDWAETVGTVAHSAPPESVEGGGVCAIAGYYFSPVIRDSRRFFKQGARFPDYKSNIGLTFWQWDVNQTE